MRAMVLTRPGEPLRLERRPIPSPADDQVQIRISACAVCRTDLHILDGELVAAPGRIPGHEIIGTVSAAGRDVPPGLLGTRVGIPWLAWTCGRCRFCTRGRENLCESARFTGLDVDGGFAEYALADPRYCFPVPEAFDDLSAAPLFCAALIGYRSLRMTGDAERLGLFGFGAAGHMVAQIARWQGRSVYAFTRAGDSAAQEFARGLGATWAGASDEQPPSLLDAAIIFAPVGELVPVALRDLEAGGTVVCGGIHMSDVPSFPYALLWRERCVRSVANLTRRDAEELLALAPRIPLVSEVHPYPLERANEALEDLRHGHFRGAAVLTFQ